MVCQALQRFDIPSGRQAGSGDSPGTERPAAGGERVPRPIPGEHGLRARENALWTAELARGTIVSRTPVGLGGSRAREPVCWFLPRRCAILVGAIEGAQGRMYEPGLAFVCERYALEWIDGLV